jgi:hypothetical protein
MNNGAKMNWMKKIAKNKDDTETVSLDFDGVIHSYESGWTGPKPEDPPVEGAVEFVKKLINADFEVVLHSTRANTKEGKQGIENWLEQHDFPNLEVHVDKPHAEVYVDDRAFRFKGNFDKAFDFIKDKKLRTPWNK